MWGGPRPFQARSRPSGSFFAYEPEMYRSDPWPAPGGVMKPGCTRVTSELKRIRVDWE